MHPGSARFTPHFLDPFGPLWQGRPLPEDPCEGTTAKRPRPRAGLGMLPRWEVGFQAVALSVRLATDSHSCNAYRLWLVSEYEWADNGRVEDIRPAGFQRCERCDPNSTNAELLRFVRFLRHWTLQLYRLGESDAV
jgi:hypothetical protein